MAKTVIAEREYKSMNLIIQDRVGMKKYKKMLEKGWEVESTTPRALLRGATYLFSRPKKSR